MKNANPDCRQTNSIKHERSTPCQNRWGCIFADAISILARRKKGILPPVLILIKFVWHLSLYHGLQKIQSPKTKQISIKEKEPPEGGANNSAWDSNPVGRFASFYSFLSAGWTTAVSPAAKTRKLAACVARRRIQNPSNTKTTFYGCQIGCQPKNVPTRMGGDVAVSLS